MTAIAEFLAVQLDADEKTATGLRLMVRFLDEINDSRSPATRQGTQLYDAAGWALDRALADIATKRKRLELHQHPDPSLRHCHYCDQLWPCPDVRLDAASYSDRTGYLQEWAP